MSVISGLVAFASQRMPWLSRHVLASAGYTLDVDRLLAGSDGVWTRHTAERQERAWRPLVDEAIAGRPRDDIQALFDLLDPIVADGTSVLEVGAGTGHVSEILVGRYPAMQYTGLEISAPSVAIALERYPGRAFLVGSAYELPYEDDAFDVVVDGVALLHMDGWRASLAEYARVARSAVILHGLTLTTGHPTTRFAKYAYGQPTTELVFDRAELLSACEAEGLTLEAETDGLDYDLGPYIGIPSSSPSWRLSPAR
jgi:SAM-dependent methyltransferase